jgi:hypothetical protein
MEMSRGDNVIRYDAVSSAVSAELVLACQRNGWLMRGGYDWQDDPYLEDYPYAFCRAASVDDLSVFFEHGNWSIRQGIVYEDLAFINQVDGGDEWWTLKRTDEGWMEFESLSAAAMIRNSPDEFKETIACMRRATPEQCRHLDYMEATEESLHSRALRNRTASRQMDAPSPQTHGEHEMSGR